MKASQPSNGIVLDGEQTEETGKQLVTDAKAGDFVAVESSLLDGTLPWYIGEIVASGADSGICYKWAKVAMTDKTTGIMVNKGDEVVDVRLWMPLGNGGGSSTYRLSDMTVPVHPGHVRFKITASEANTSKMFKQRRLCVPVECPEGHAVVKNNDSDDLANCDCNLCGAAPSPWTCPKVDAEEAAVCNYDLCTDCKEHKGKIRVLHSDTKTAIFNSMPNVGGPSDPFHGKEHVGVWHKLHTVKDSSENVQAIAIKLRVSQKELIAHNGFDNQVLHAGSRFRKGTTLWAPGSGDCMDCMDDGCCSSSSK